MATSVTKGNLLEAGTDALVNTVNCVGIMGKGIALQFKRRYPAMFAEYRRACEQHRVQIGKMHIYPVEQLTAPRYIINFPTKRHWKGASKLEWIEQGLPDLVEQVQRLGIRSIAIPPLGAGNGGLKWEEVEPLILNAFADVDVDVRLFAPTADSSRPIDRLSRLTMSPTRALLLQLMRSYQNKRATLDPWDPPPGVSHLEIQKLMYFAAVLAPELKLDFKQGHYGPYSDIIRHIVQEMEGQFTTGFGDGSAKVLSMEPISLTEEGERALDQYLPTENGRRAAALSDKVLMVTDGYEDAYGVELLASTFMVAGDDWANTARIARNVRGWNPRKSLLFTDDHIANAVRHLQGAGIRG